MKHLAYIIMLALILYAKESLFLNLPGEYPSKKSEASFGKELISHP